ncbi:hypothetical protein [Sphingomonas soli]|uniref:hypothetical protein n=1 Tax=Sphingomonas soli TaxID=266127 RepID=UPI0008355638|nr:hypothetical protein [Sphingomonas soli]
MKLIRGALVGAATLALAAAPAVASAGNASKLSLRAATASKNKSDAVPVIPPVLASVLVVGVIVGTVVIARQSPDSP